MNFETIRWDNGRAVIIDQTLLPTEEKYLAITDYRDMIEAIKKLRVRGAPALGVAGAMGLALGALEAECGDTAGFIDRVLAIKEEIAASRPTAVNLAWGLNRLASLLKGENLTPDKIRRSFIAEAEKIHAEDLDMCRKIGDFGSTLVPAGASILTHCNAGGLATAGYGTALGVIRSAHAAGKNIRVYADETRPLLQGARLTAWELMKDGIDVTLICDNMAGCMMSQKAIGLAVVGADRIAANGDTANKIGTYSVAVLAAYHKIPFYMAAPYSTFDLSIESGGLIPIEERGREEIICGFGKQTAPADVKVKNPAFDVTPAELITAIICEKGIIYPPFKDNIKKLITQI